MAKLICILALTNSALLVGIPTFAQVLTFGFQVGASIPDGVSSGLADTRVIQTPFQELASIDVGLSIGRDATPGFNGDLFVSLLHEDGFAILLNRVGRSANSAYGYGDSGMDITLSDDATADIHLYRAILHGNPDTSVSGVLSGIWKPDGRLEDPAGVLDTNPSVATLDVFRNTNPNGQWTLFVADLVSGGTSRLESWSLTITAVPELPLSGVAITLSLLVWRLLGHRSRSGPMP